ncbi:MAG TPA: hypothetical protein VNT30_09255 [Stellaceae bacterium]|nr:hypothetical protein [Stellaceae bacterium]
MSGGFPFGKHSPSPRDAVLAHKTSIVRASAALLNERNRQVDVEGYSTDHDDLHGYRQLAAAAGAYALSASGADEAKHQWPWQMAEFNPKDPRRDLVRAGALILAAINAFDRKAAGDKADRQAARNAADQAAKS